jgi:hypothetical protein
MCCEQITGARRRKRNVEGLLVVFHEVPRPFERCKSSMAFVQMANLRLDSERA